LEFLRQVFEGSESLLAVFGEFLGWVFYDEPEIVPQAAPVTERVFGGLKSQKLEHAAKLRTP
jgi:hypothetical protein